MGPPGPASCGTSVSATCWNELNIYTLERNGLESVRFQGHVLIKKERGFRHLPGSSGARPDVTLAFRIDIKGPRLAFYHFRADHNLLNAFKGRQIEHCVEQD
jgi:hypothetical protein